MKFKKFPLLITAVFALASCSNTQASSKEASSAPVSWPASSDVSVPSSSERPSSSKEASSSRASSSSSSSSVYSSEVDASSGSSEHQESSSSLEESSSASSSNSSSSASSSSAEPVHEHTFDMGTWEHDSEYHWHPSTCGHDVTTPPVAHAFSKNVTEATYSSGGYTTYTCDVCGFCYTADRTDPVELKYTIIFDLNGGSSASYVSSKEVKTLSASDFFFDCRKSGYNFRGWSYNGIKVFDENGKQLFTPNMELTMTFVAVFANDASMSIWSNMTEAGTVSGSGYYEYNTDVNVSATPYQGYAFVGWYDEDGILLSSQTSYKYRMSESDIVIEARFKLADFDLKIESNSFDLGTVFINPVSSTSTSRYEVSKQSSITYTNNVKIAA